MEELLESLGGGLLSLDPGALDASGCDSESR